MGYAGLQPDDPREIGPYRLLTRLSSGGRGQAFLGPVFLGVCAAGRRIAVRVIRTELAEDPEFRARFRRDVAAARKVSGLFTALVVDADLDSPMPWLATAYVAGPSLSEAVRGHGPLPVRTLLKLTAGVAESLSAIHAAGVVHRDLKPSNVLLAEDGPRVIDFGISGAAAASMAAGTSLMIGSPGFMSPEQALGLDIGSASDMFSLGAVLAFAATGHGPFGSGSDAALRYRLVNTPPSLGNVPGELRPLIGSCLAKHPSDRPAARELLAKVGAIQPTPGWLTESIISSVTADRPAVAPAGPAVPADAGNHALTESASGPPPGGGGRPGRHRISRPLASACLSGGLVAASAVAVFALIGANRTPLATHAQPRAGAGAVATTPAPVSNAPATPRGSSSAAPSVSVAPNAYLTPAFSQSLSPSVLPTPNPPATAKPTTSGNPGNSPSASASASPSASSSASSSASGSPSASTSPSPSPSSGSPSTSASGSASPSPSPSSSASTSASSSASASTSVSSSPPPSPSSTAPTSSSPSPSATLSPSATST